MKTFLESESTKKEIKFNQTFIDITVEYLEEGGEMDRDVKVYSSVKIKFGNEVDYHVTLKKYKSRTDI